MAKAISVRAPWWWFILHGGKDIENRDWYTNYRGPVVIHASKWWNANEIIQDINDVRELIGLPADKIPRLTDLKELGGHAVGEIEIVGCVKAHNSKWFRGKYGFVLRNPQPFARPFPIKGALGLFEVEEQPHERT